MRPLRLLALVALFLALSPSPAAAADIRSGDVTIGTTETIDDQIGRDLQVGGTNAKIDGGIGGSVLATVERLQLTDRATVGGSLKYTSKNEAQIANMSSVKGTIERQTPDPGRAPLVTGQA